MLERLPQDGAGLSAQRRHAELAKRWRRRVIGRRTIVYTWTILTLVLMLLVNLDLSGRVALVAGTCLGMAVMAAWMLPSALLPGHIFAWQLGAWAEQNTASELRKLRRHGWTIRHDVRWGDRGANHDHVVAGRAVFVLNTKNLKDSTVTVEGTALRVRRLDNPDDSYLADRWVGQIESEARSLKYELGRAVGFPVHVYPVLVVWGGFGAAMEHVGDVAVVRGDRLVHWLTGRPADLLTAVKCDQVANTVRALPRA